MAASPRHLRQRYVNDTCDAVTGPQPQHEKIILRLRCDIAVGSERLAAISFREKDEVCLDWAFRGTPLKA